MNCTRRIAAALFLCTTMLAASAMAETDAPRAATRAGAPAGDLAGFGPVLGDEALAAHRGGQEDAFFNETRSRATLTQTTATNVSTGTNSITEGAFTNANGFPMVIQNTGNNVIIQNSTILNLQLH